MFIKGNSLELFFNCSNDQQTIYHDAFSHTVLPVFIFPNVLPCISQVFRSKVSVLHQACQLPKFQLWFRPLL